MGRCAARDTWWLCRLARSAATYGRPSEALPPLPFIVVEPPENPTFSTKKEKYGGGNLKNESKDGFSGGASAGVPAQVAGLSLRFSHFARNRFEFQYIREP